MTARPDPLDLARDELRVLWARIARQQVQLADAEARRAAAVAALDAATRERDAALAALEEWTRGQGDPPGGAQVEAPAEPGA